MINDQLLESYIDGTLQEQEKHSLETRMQTDTELKARIERMRRIERAATETLSVTAPDTLSSSVMQSIHAGALNKQLNIGSRALYLYLGIITALGIAAFFLPSTNGQKLSFLDPAVEWLSKQLTAASTTTASLIESLSHSCDTTSPVLPVVLGAVLLLAILDLYLFKPRSQKF